MTSLSPSHDDRMTPAVRTYLRWLVVSMSVYVSLLVTSLFALRRIAEDALVLRAALGLLPALPLIVLVWAYVRYVREADEMQRLIELQSMACASAAVCIGYLVAGFLASAGVISLRGELTAILVMPAMCGVYGVAKMVLHWKIER